MGSKGIFFLVAGPTAAGKTTVLRRLVEISSGLVKDVSVTTRPPRPGEVDGSDYHFWDLRRFRKGLEAGKFMEHALVHGTDSYGTLRRFVVERLKQGTDVIKDIDVQGATQIRKGMPYPETVAIFLVPPSLQELIGRFDKRGTEDQAVKARRLATIKRETRRIRDYDYLVLNRTVDETVYDLDAIRRAEHCKRVRREQEFKQTWQVRL
jgi:guanylate kinase